MVLTSHGRSEDLTSTGGAGVYRRSAALSMKGSMQIAPH